MANLSRLLRWLPFASRFLSVPTPPKPQEPEILLIPPPGAVSYTSRQLSLSVNESGRFDCFHCGNLPKRGDVVLVKMDSGREIVMIVQSMKPRNREFEDTGLRFGTGEFIDYLENVTFPIPPPAKLGFILG